MKLYLKRDVSDITARFCVIDELGNEKYHIVGSKGHAGEKMQINSLSGDRLLTIKKMPLPVLHAFSIGDKNENIKLIVNTSNKSATCYFYGISWKINSDFSLGSYKITDADGTPVSSCCKTFGRHGDCLQLEIFKENRELFCLASAVCLASFICVENLALQSV